MDRAYSVLTVKSIDEEQRVFEGLASTPTPDRLGDIVEPLGMKYALPMPLLLYHDNTRPVGTVDFARATKDGMPFRASIPKVTEPGVIKDRVDEAWHSIKHRLISAVSIGFKPVKDQVERLKDGGLRFLESEWLELSLVVVPANQDARISLIKSIDTQQRAALGQNARGVVRLDSTAGASATNPKAQEAGAMNVSEQIKAFEAKRMASADRMEAIMSKAADEGRTLDESEDEAYKNATAEVQSVDDHLVRLHDLERMQATRAKVVTDVTSVADGGRARDPAAAIYVTAQENLPKGVEFARYVKCLAAARGNRWEALEMAKANYPQHPRIHTVLKAAVAAGTTTDATWAGPFVEYQTLTSEFIDYLRPQTIIGKFGTGVVPALNSVPFNVRIQEQTSPGAGYWVGEGAPKPLTSFDFTSRTFGFAKVANIAVLTDELVRFSNPSADLRVRQSLADALRARMDIDFIDPAKALVAGVSPASITNGLTPIASAGSGVDGVRADLEALLGAFSAAGLTPNAVIMSAGNALALSMMVGPLGQPAFEGITATGGSFKGLPVIVSEYVTQVGDSTGSPIIMLNTSEVYLADDGQVTIDASREASLEMLDNPTNNSATGTATSLVSMFQTNSVALKAERFINWARRRDAGVQYIEAAAYSSVTT
jgi:HK97 family phage major capsid protein/HK97 family phage prohead protease